MTRLLYIHALSPLHAGTGQSIGAIDLAIARDRSSGFPYLPGSSLKGSLRARSMDSVGASQTTPIFGPETANASDHAGALLMGDANLLLLPVRSVAGTFAWVTSPFLLHRYARDCTEAKTSVPPVPAVKDIKEALVVAGSSLIADKRVIFEDLDFTAHEDAGLKHWADHLGAAIFGKQGAWAGLLAGRLCVVHDDAMAFLSEQATDVVTRVSIDPDKKTAKEGQLWTEENLPVESVLVSLVAAMSNGRIKPPEAFQLLGALCEQPLQLGGKATVGRGRCRLVLAAGGK